MRKLLHALTKKASYKISVPGILLSCCNNHYENLPMQHTKIFFKSKIEIFIEKKIDFLIFWLKTYIVGTR